MVLDSPVQEKIRVAVASSDGVTVNQHLGRAKQFLIFDVYADSLELIETKAAPPGGPHRAIEYWKEIEQLLTGCKALFCSGLGERGWQELAGLGIEPIETDLEIKNAVAHYLREVLGIRVGHKAFSKRVEENIKRKRQADEGRG